MHTARLATFLKFAGLSGLGWLLDAALLTGLVAFAHWPPFGANLLSSCTAATCVFLLSRETIFRKEAHATALRIGAYIGYSLCVIVVASTALGLLVGWMTPLLAPPHGNWSATAVAVLAKVLVTPPQLLLNFVTSRFLSERKARGV